MSKLQKMLNESCREISVRTYSGRGMYGDQCLAITGNISDLLCALRDVAQELGEDLYDAGMDEMNEVRDELLKTLKSMFDYQQDSMGRGTVIYWPSIDFEDEDEHDDYDQSDDNEYNDE